jgi:hypothetical protein
MTLIFPGDFWELCWKFGYRRKQIEIASLMSWHVGRHSSRTPAFLTFEAFRLIVNVNITVELFGFFWDLFAVAATVSKRCGLMLARNPLVRLDVRAIFWELFVFCRKARWGLEESGEGS